MEHVNRLQKQFPSHVIKQSESLDYTDQSISNYIRLYKAFITFYPFINVYGVKNSSSSITS